MSSLLFYVSGHGFGHASRQVEIINVVRSRRPDLAIRLRTAVSRSLLDRTIRGPYDLLPGPCDVGVIQIDSVTHDDAATAREAAAFYDRFEARIDADVTALAGLDVSLIVGDIPPLAFDVAERLGVPSIAIANFTWDWIYDAMPEIRAAAPRLSDRLRAAYRNATRALALPFTGGFEVFDRVEAIPLIARRATRVRRDTRSHFELPQTGRVALLSFGGYGLPSLDLSALDCLPEWTIVTTDRTSGSGGAVPSSVRFVSETAFIDSGYRYEDLVAAVDVVVTKPGYGIIAECAANGPAMLYTSRGAFREYDLLVRDMPSVIRCRYLPQPDVFAGRWRDALEALLAQPRPPRPRTDGAEIAADRILALLA